MKFIRNIGDYRVHDGKIIEINMTNNNVSVKVQCQKDEILEFVFYDIKFIKENKPIGMWLYSIREMTTDNPYRYFNFLNWDEEDEAYLDIIAKNFEQK